MSNHTNGPWRVNYKKFSQVLNEGGALIADVKNLDGLVATQATARLIAAAPDLFQALQAMLSLDEEHSQRGGSDEDVCLEVRQARAAIAKALGHNT